MLFRKMNIFLSLLASITIIGAREDFEIVIAEEEVINNPCNDTDDIVARYEVGKPPEEENEYSVSIAFEMPKTTEVNLQFDSPAIVVLANSSVARIELDGNNFNVRFFRNADSLEFTVKGARMGTIPYLKSVRINYQEYCEVPKSGYFDQYILGYKDTAATHLKGPDGCGRRKVEHTELIVNAEASKAGYWPWHAAVYRVKGSIKTYTCGGTLLSKTMVLTAAHCTSVREIPLNPEALRVVLGKYHLTEQDFEAQEREVLSVIVHEDFAPRHFLDNDIALLKLKSEVTYNDYIQPACIWYNGVNDRLPTNNVFGTVVGWGLNELEALSSQLKQASMPIVSNFDCIIQNPVFYGNSLNDKKFCAGYTNGTSVCNGDSGGGFVVFVPDTAKDTSYDAIGSWYVRGIVSLSSALRNEARCDPNKYAIFTDVAKHVSWVQKHLVD